MSGRRKTTMQHLSDALISLTKARDRALLVDVADEIQLLVNDVVALRRKLRAAKEAL